MPCAIFAVVLAVAGHIKRRSYLPVWRGPIKKGEFGVRSISTLSKVWFSKSDSLYHDTTVSPAWESITSIFTSYLC